MNVLEVGKVILQALGVVVPVVIWRWYAIMGALEKSPSYRREIANALTSHAWLETYQDRLGRGLDWLDHPRRMGPLNTWLGAFQGFNVCLAMSATYSALFLIIGWMFGGPGSVGNTHFLPPLHDAMAQFGWGAVLLALSVVVSLGLIRGKVIDAGCEAWLAQRLAPFGVTAHLAKWPYRLGGAIAAAILWLVAAFYSDLSGAIMVGVIVSGAAGVASAAAGTVAGAIAIASAAAGGVAIGGTVTGGILGVFALTLGGVVVLPGVGAATFASAFAFAFLGTAALILAGAGAVAVTVTLAGAVAVTGGITAAVFKGDGFLAGSLTGAIGAAAAAAGTVAIAGLTGHPENPFAVALLLFAVILPVVNALVDWASWWVSRKLGRHLTTTIGRASGHWSKTGVLSLHLVIDLLVAVGLLYLLAVALPFVIELFNLWCRSAGLAEPLPLLAFVTQAVQRPFPNAIWVLTMLLSTLVPTLFHAVFLMASPVMVWLRSDERRDEIATKLRAKEPEYLEIRDACQQLMQAWLIGMIASLALVALFVGAIDTLWHPVSELLLDATYDGMAGAGQIASWLGFPSGHDHRFGH